MTPNKKDLSTTNMPAVMEFRNSLRTDCYNCDLGEQVKEQNHWPVGSRGFGRIMIVGHAPGEEEHRNGSPFVGRAGVAVTKLLWQYCGLTEDQVCFTNTLRCRPHATTKFKRSYFKACAPYLLKEINLVDPLLIVYFGNDAACGTVDREDNPGTGRFFRARIAGKMRQCYLMIHPAVVFRVPKMRATVLSQFEILGSYIYKTFGYRGQRTPEIAEIPGTLITAQSEVTPTYTLVDSLKSLKLMYEDLLQYKLLGADTETNSLNVWADEFQLVGVSLAGREDHAYYIPVGHKFDPRNILASGFTQLRWEDQVRPVLRRLLLGEGRSTVFHNFSYDYRVLKKCGITFPPLDIHAQQKQYHDSMVLCYLDNESVQSISLKGQMATHFHEYPRTFSAVLGGNKTFEYVAPQDALTYAGDDARNALRLFNKIMKSVKQQSDERTAGQLLHRIYPTELRTAQIMSDAHMIGIKLDRDYVEQLKLTIIDDIQEVEDHVYRICTLAQPGSSQQLTSLIRQIIKDKSFLESFEKEFGELSAKKSQLTQLCSQYRAVYERAQNDPEGAVLPGSWPPGRFEDYIISVIRYRHLSKMLTTYVMAFLNEAQSLPNGDLIFHPDFKTIGTTSGRMSSGSRSAEDETI